MKIHEIKTDHGVYTIIVETSLEGDEQPEHVFLYGTTWGWDFKDASITEEEFYEELYAPIENLVRERNGNRFTRICRIADRLIEKRLQGGINMSEIDIGKAYPQYIVWRKPATSKRHKGKMETVLTKVYPPSGSQVDIRLRNINTGGFTREGVRLSLEDAVSLSKALSRLVEHLEEERESEEVVTG